MDQYTTNRVFRGDRQSRHPRAVCYMSEAAQHERERNVAEMEKPRWSITFLRLADHWRVALVEGAART
mgnify:FL=1